MLQLRMRRLIQTGLVLLLALAPLRAAELANLRNGFSIRHERHEVLGDITRLYTGADGTGYIDVATAEVNGFEPAPPEPKMAETPKPVDLNEIIREVSRRSQLDSDFIAAVIRAESGGNTQAVSRKGARGLMQLMPGTADQLGVKNSFDAAENVDGGVRYLMSLLQQFNYDVAKALAAYNAGPHRVTQYKGVPPYYETRAYVARIIRDYNRKKLAEQKQAQVVAARTSPGDGGE
jgi:soluble lytic murein transglycosylase-like protein